MQVKFGFIIVILCCAVVAGVGEVHVWRAAPRCPCLSHCPYSNYAYTPHTFMTCIQIYIFTYHIYSNMNVYMYICIYVYMYICIYGIYICQIKWLDSGTMPGQLQSRWCNVPSVSIAGDQPRYLWLLLYFTSSVEQAGEKSYGRAKNWQNWDQIKLSPRKEVLRLAMARKQETRDGGASRSVPQVHRDLRGQQNYISVPSSPKGDTRGAFQIAASPSDLCCTGFVVWMASDLQHMSSFQKDHYRQAVGITPAPLRFIVPWSTGLFFRGAGGLWNRSGAGEPHIPCSWIAEEWQLDSVAGLVDHWVAERNTLFLYLLHCYLWASSF
jgi:hypothetical protein